MTDQLLAEVNGKIIISLKFHKYLIILAVADEKVININEDRLRREGRGKPSVPLSSREKALNPQPPKTFKTESKLIIETHSQH